MASQGISKKELAEKISKLEKKAATEGLTAKERAKLKKYQIDYTHRVSGFNRVHIVSGGSAGSKKK